VKQSLMIRWSSLLVLTLVGSSLAGCGEDLEAKAAGEDCFTSITGYTSPATGVLTFQGHFFDNESILVRDAETNAQVASGTPATDRSSFTFTGIPSGMHSYDVYVSCEQAGQVKSFSEVMTVQ
jgi:hypothetical protein